jgi:hypothetical protein
MLENYVMPLMEEVRDLIFQFDGELNILDILFIQAWI